jgi:hypothetical protein
MEFLDIASNIKHAFGSLWKTKQRGETLEIITPYATTNDRFISVFLSKQNNQFVISDGGWISEETYDNNSKNVAECFFKVQNHYIEQYNILSTRNKSGQLFYYKKSKSEIDIPALVFDVSAFISAIASTSLITFEDEKEKAEKETFKRMANGFIRSFVEVDRIKLNQFIDPNHKTIRFNAVIQSKKGSSLTLVNYVTGSNTNYFINSICKTTINYEITSKSSYDAYIKNRITIFNDNAEGYQPNKFADYVEQLVNATNNEPVIWSQKEKLQEII